MAFDIDEWGSGRIRRRQKRAAKTEKLGEEGALGTRKARKYREGILASALVDPEGGKVDPQETAAAKAAAAEGSYAGLAGVLQGTGTGGMGPMSSMAGTALQAQALKEGSTTGQGAAAAAAPLAQSESINRALAAWDSLRQEYYALEENRQAKVDKWTSFGSSASGAAIAGQASQTT